MKQVGVKRNNRGLVKGLLLSQVSCIMLADTYKFLMRLM